LEKVEYRIAETLGKASQRIGALFKNRTTDPRQIDGQSPILERPGQFEANLWGQGLDLEILAGGAGLKATNPWGSWKTTCF
jgi:hypothetical protein